MWLSGYSVEPYRVDRVNRPSLEILPCLSALFFCQPSVLLEIITNEEALERGLTARTLPFIVQSELKEDDGVLRIISQRASDNWKTVIRAVLSKRARSPAKHRKSRIESLVRQSPVRSSANFTTRSVRLRNGAFRSDEGELGRWRENAIRIAVGQCVADDINASDLSEAQARRAVELTRWFVFSSLKIMQAGRVQRRMKRLEEVVALLVQCGGNLTLRDLERRHGVSHEEAKQLAADFPGRVQRQTEIGRQANRDPYSSPEFKMTRLAFIAAKTCETCNSMRIFSLFRALICKTCETCEANNPTGKSRSRARWNLVQRRLGTNNAAENNAMNLNAKFGKKPTIKEKIRASNPKKRGTVARARARGKPAVTPFSVKMPKAIKSLLEQITDEDIARVAEPGAMRSRPQR